LGHSGVQIRFNSSVLLAAKVLPRGSRYDPVPWWHQDINDAVEIRDLLRQEAGLCDENRNEWVNACQLVVKVIKEKRLEYWRENNTRTTYTTNPGKVAAVIKGINRDPRTSTNIAIVTPKGRVLTDDKEKATAFRGEFSKVSSNTHNEETRSRKYRAENRIEKIEMKKYVNSDCHSPQASSFSSTEFDAQLQALEDKRAPGPDGIHNEMLKNLEADMKGELLVVINMSWATGSSPASWLCGVIIPIHKSGKDKVNLSSYRPVCLMSVVAKMAERLITCRLRYDLESRGILSPNQSGFRSGRSTADPLLRLISDIQGGLNRPAPAHRTVAALIDLSRAFDKVCHQKLLLEFKVLEIPSCYAKWYQGFLSHRMYRVRYGDSESGYCRFANGVPQGSVSGPLLFIIFVNSLSVLLSTLESEGLRHHLLADDTTIWNTNNNIGSIKDVIQKGLDVIVGWCKKYRMFINFGKNEGILFTTNPQDHAIEFRITLEGDVIGMKKEVRLLGIMLDSAVTMVSHVKKLQKICHFRQRQLSAIAGYGWGGHSRDNRAAYFAFVHSQLIYNSSVFSPFLSATNMNVLERLQNTGARIITGLPKATIIDELLLEANLRPLSVYFKSQCANAAEKAKRMPPGDPMSIMVAGRVPPSRLIKTAESFQHVSNRIFNEMKWREGRVNDNGYEITGEGGNFTGKLDVRNRDPILTHPISPPWACNNATKIKFMTHLVSPCIHSDSAEVWKKASDDSIAVHGIMDIEMFTDGSVVNKLGAGAADIYEQRLIGGNKVYRVVAPAGALCSSYKSEIVGVQCGLDKLISTEAITKEDKCIIICTDSQSLVAALAKGPITQKLKPCSDIWYSCLSLLDIHKVSSIVFQFVKSHVGILKNERVDKACGEALIKYSKEKLGFSQKKAVILLQGIKAEVKQHLVRQYKNNLKITDRYLICGDKESDLKLSATYSRTDEVLCSQLRVDRCTLMGSYGFTLKTRQSPLCRWCHIAKETVVHVFSECQSPYIIQLRQDLNIQDVTVLHKSPLLGLKFCRDAINII
jgi:ribonuclease HI